MDKLTPEEIEAIQTTAAIALGLPLPDTNKKSGTEPKPRLTAYIYSVRNVIDCYFVGEEIYVFINGKAIKKTIKKIIKEDCLTGFEMPRDSSYCLEKSSFIYRCLGKDDNVLIDITGSNLIITYGYKTMEVNNE